jgi:glucarate dehydratase
VHAPNALRTNVKLVTNEGIVGLGETYGGGQMTSALEHARATIIGEDPFHLPRLRLKIGNARTFAAIEMACLDAMGKATSRPVCDLLGGKVRDRVPFSAYLFYRLAGPDGQGAVTTPQAMLGEAEEFVRRYGFRSLKLKGGVYPPQVDIESLRLMRQRFDAGYELRVDPNCIWSVETSIRVCNKLKELDMEYVEDPTENMAGMATVRRTTGMPLATNHCVVNFEQIPAAVQMGAVDVVLSDIHYWGGLSGCLRLAEICATFGLGVGMHSNSHLGISMAAMTHLAAVVPNLLHACDTHYPWLEEDVIVGEGFRFQEGSLEAPAGPGLGVELDEAKLSRFADFYRNRAMQARDDGLEMMKRDPRWLPFRPRW